MIMEERGRVDYDECGAGRTIVLVPGSCSTGAAWRPVVAAWDNQFRCVTTSLLGYGGTAERRTVADPSIAHEAEALESVIRKPAVMFIWLGIPLADWWRLLSRSASASPWQVS